MAQCMQSPQEFIKNAFTPQIAVMCTPEAAKSCEKNNLNFIELLQPFSRLTNELHCKDPFGTQVAQKDLKITFVDVKSSPPQTGIAKKLLNSSVSDAPEAKEKTVNIGENKIHIIPATTPWFENWRETFIQVQYPSDHEFTRHYLACLLVVSSMDKNPVEAMAQLVQTLSQIQNTSPGKFPKWFSANVLKYHVILHDIVEGKNKKVTESHESLKNSYGMNNCFLLRINSRPPEPVQVGVLPDPWCQFLSNRINTKDIKVTPDSSPNSMRHSLEIGQEANEAKAENYHPLSPDTEELMTDICNDKEIPLQIKARNTQHHGACLAVTDIEQIKLMVYEFLKNCLVPYVEKQMVLLNDAVANKKGVSKSLFSATKRWFSPNKPGASSVAVNNLIYSPDSPELQVRRLGDLYFMFGHYTLAFQAYHLAKRDYNGDQAWLYYAGALEMAALSAFLANEASRKTYDYMEEAITTYLNTCKMPQFATRATILSLEILKDKNMFGEAAHQLIRMTSEESDLRSALLLEQAAYCFLATKMTRKYAFHMVLAGHRFSKAAQRKHSLRCYKQSYDVYQNTGWDLAEDHIHYTIGKQANNLHQYDDAVRFFSALLKGSSKQSAQQQAVFLREYLTILDNKLKNEPTLCIPTLPVPDLNNSSLKILLGPTRPLSAPGRVPALEFNFNSSEDSASETKWTKLEEMIVTEAEGQLPMLFKPHITLFNVSKLEKHKPVAVMNEPIQLFIELENTLQTVLTLKDIYLLSNFKNDAMNISNDNINDIHEKFIKTHVIKSVIIQGNCKQDLVLVITPLSTGSITLTGICYTIETSNTTTDIISIKGKKDLAIVGPNKTPIVIDVVSPAPRLQVTFSEMSPDFLADEIRRISIEFQNVGTVPLQNIYMATSLPHLLSNCEFKGLSEDFVLPKDIDTPATKDKLARRNHITRVPLTDSKLEAGQSTIVYIWMKAPHHKGPASIDLLIYYENCNKQLIPRYRLVRHRWNLAVKESISLETSCQSSCKSTDSERITISIKSTNLNKIHDSVSTEIEPIMLSLISKNWELQDNIIAPEVVTLWSQESVHMLLKAKRAKFKDGHYSMVCINSARKGQISNLDTALLAFARKTEKCLVNVFDDFDTLSNFKENKDGALFMQWSALVTDGSNKRTINGQTHVFIEVNRGKSDANRVEKLLADTIFDIMPPTPPQDKKELAQKRLTYNVTHSAIVKHCFEKEGRCFVPVNLIIHSTVEDKTLNVIVETSTKTEASPNSSQQTRPEGSQDFCWVANTNTHRVLQPLETTNVCLLMFTRRPGTYDLGANLKIFCSELDEDTPVLQSCRILSTIIIENVNS